MQRLLFAFLVVITTLSTSYTQDVRFKKLKISYTGEIYFDSGKNDLKKEATIALDSTLFFFKKDTTQKIFLTAHTDAQGAIDANKALSLRRSQVVKLFLVENGIPLSKIQSEEFGEDKPSASNDDELGRQKNRHVTIEVSKFVPLVKVTGIVKDSVGPVADAWVYFRSPNYQDSTKTNQEGVYQLYGIDKAITNISVLAKDYFFENQTFKLDIAKIKPLEFKLVTPQIGQTVTLKNMYFVSGQPIVLPRSEPALRDLLLFLQLNKNYKIEIAGHINIPNQMRLKADHPFFKLSEDRAKTVFDFLVKNGVDSERLTPKGYGNSFMKFPKAVTEMEQEANRRVEIKILGK
jgi:outer membrane protein OmpA-like peptidoglycan-associated protein